MRKPLNRDQIGGLAFLAFIGMFAVAWFLAGIVDRKLAHPQVLTWKQQPGVWMHVTPGKQDYRPVEPKPERKGCAWYADENGIEHGVPCVTPWQK